MLITSNLHTWSLSTESCLFIPTEGPSPATRCSPNAWHCFILLLLIPSATISPWTIPKPILSCFSLVCFCPPQTFVFYFLSKPALAAFPSLASSTHFINILFTSACRSLATILNNWQFAQEAAMSGVDDLFYFPSLREQQKQQRWVDVEMPEPRAEMRGSLLAFSSKCPALLCL